MTSIQRLLVFSLLVGFSSSGFAQSASPNCEVRSIEIFAET
jgi:hypothetical protein